MSGTKKNRKLRLSKSTLRRLTSPELQTVQGAAVDPQQPETRAFTGCEYCGHTNAAPRPCQPSYTGPCATYEVTDPACIDYVYTEDGGPPECTSTCPWDR
jgi:hypothetical protein